MYEVTTYKKRYLYHVCHPCSNTYSGGSERRGGALTNDESLPASEGAFSNLGLFLLFQFSYNNRNFLETVTRPRESIAMSSSTLFKIAGGIFLLIPLGHTQMYLEVLAPGLKSLGASPAAYASNVSWSSANVSGRFIGNVVCKCQV